jgi:heptaprenyl diphosphate synthase
MAKADEGIVDNMKDYGHCLGMAFQITDDILDIVADDRQIGKPAGNDLKQGIMTLPIIYALHNSPDKNELHAIIERRSPTAEDVDKGITIIRATDAVEYAYDLADKYIRKAKERATVIQDCALRDSFIRIADFVGERNY